MRLLTPNIPSYDNFHDKFKHLLIWRISIISLFLYAFRLLLFLKTNPLVNTVAIISLSSVIVISLFNIIYLKFSRKTIVVYWVCAIFSTIVIHFTLNNIILTPLYSSFLWCLAIILLVFIGLGRKVGFAFVFIHSIGIIFFYFFSFNNHIKTVQVQNTISIIHELISIFTPFLFIIYLMGQYMIQKSHSSHLLSIANQKLINQNKIITTRDNEKTTLVKEIHHRVKNNLQIIISLLRLQKGELKSVEAKSQFSEAINRIMVMSLIHQKLYQEKQLAEIEIKSYLTDLTKDIKKLSDLGTPIDINITSDIKVIGLKTIVPLGLIINELISNSIKHAFFKMEKGVIHINISEKDNKKLMLSYSDNGKWTIPNKNNPSFGLELLNILTEQLEGSFKRKSDNNGTSYSFVINNLDIEK